MNKSFNLSFIILSTIICANAHGQQLQNGYITPPTAYHLHNYVNDWQPGKELTTTYINATSVEWEDEEFFTSRVALKPYFVNLNTQIDKTKPDSENKRLLFWVPINESSGSNNEWLNALPNAKYDSEVFSTWSYVTHYSNWASPFGWVPGAMADAAHKNGVLVSGVAPIPFGSISTAWANCLVGIGAMNTTEGVEKLGRFLRYHGVDGLAYNSQFSDGETLGANLRGTHGKLTKWMKQYQPVFDNVWYSVTNDNGIANNSDRLGSDMYETFGYSTEPRTALFLGNGWSGTNNLKQTAAGIEATGRDPRDIYTGVSTLNGSIGNASDWYTHLSIPYSIGIRSNPIWKNRDYDNGHYVKPLINDKTRQTSYQRLLEYWFTNGKRNPLHTMPTINSLTPSSNFMGMSRYMEARSSLGWDLTQEPFVSYFNIGNGTYYNWKGENSHTGEWYNLGVQDYMPTWRFWISGEYLGTNPSENIDAAITWDDAYMGGSSLLITAYHNTTDYLHLFKTNFNIKNNTSLTIRYKVIKGSGDVEIVWSNVGNESSEAQGAYGKLFDSNGNTYSSTNPDGQIEYKEWQVKTIKMSSRNNLSGNIMAALGLKISNAKDLELLIGEISITNGSYPKPNPPIITRAKVLAYNRHGIDGKVFYKMSNNKAPGDPVYNLDVKTSLFRLWSRTDVDTEPQFIGTTSSWAGMLFAAPATNASTIQFGVSAVSLDFNQESEITWSPEMPVGDYTVSNEIEVSNNPVYTNEEFSVRFIDPKSPNASWQIKDETGSVVASSNSATEITVPNGLKQAGLYDVVVNDIVYPALITVTESGVGRKPVIESLSIDGHEPIEDKITIQSGSELTLRYTAREADGKNSRGLVLDHNPIGVKVKDLGIGQYQSFSVAFWLKVDEYSDYQPCSLLLIENRDTTWPLNCFGYFWSRTTNGSFRNDYVDGGFGKRLSAENYGNRLYCDYDGNLGRAKWNHLVYVFEYENDKYVRTKFYLNGELLKIKNWVCMAESTRENKIGSDGWSDITNTAGYQSDAIAYGSNTTEPDWCIDQFPLLPTDWIKVGGYGPNGMPAIYGAIDDFQIWGKAMTQEDVILSKNGLGNLEKLPEDVIAFWDMESEPDTDFGFVSLGKNAVKSYVFSYTTSAIEGAFDSHSPIEPIYTAGSPFVAGKANVVTTIPHWNTPIGTISEAHGNDTEGEAKLHLNTNKKSGDYTVSLTLSNPLGEDTKNYPVFTINTMDALESTINDWGRDVNAYSVSDGLFIQFAHDGVYTVEVYNANGWLVAKKHTTMTSGQNMFVNIDTQGIYMIKVFDSDSLIRTLKVKK